MKFGCVGTIVIGLEGDYDVSQIRFIGLKGEVLRAKTRPKETVYEVLGSAKDVDKMPEENGGFLSMGV